MSHRPQAFLLASAVIALATARVSLADSAAPRLFASTQAGFTRQSEEVLPYAPDRIILKFTKAGMRAARLDIDMQKSAATPVADTGLASVDVLCREVGVFRISRPYIRPANLTMVEQLGIDRVFMFELEASVDIPAVAERFATYPDIEYAVPDYKAFPAVVPNDPMYYLQWGHNNTAQMLSYDWSTHSHENGSPVGTVGFDANTEAAWDGSQGYCDTGVVIAIVDTGTDIDHPDLRLVAGYDYGDNDSDPDDNSASPGHGTACAGVAAAMANNGLGVAGIAGGCSVMPLKVANSAGTIYFSSVQNALYHAADNGADVVSMSLGAAISSDPPTDAAIQYAYNAGVTILAATGNENARTIDYPAVHSLVIGVGAASPCGERKRSSSNPGEVNPGVDTDPNGYTCDGERWWGSNYGVNSPDAAGAVDVIAPTIMPTTDIGAGGGYDSSDYYKWFNGTSCATPYAAGVCALIISVNPGWAPAQVRDQLVNTAQDIISVESGPGWDPYTGYGMVDAEAAVGGGGPVPPTAAFVGNPTSGMIPLVVSFSDQSTGSPTSWGWTFGDAGTSSAQNPIYIYNTAGTYTVTLTVNNAAGSDVETKTDYITVNPCVAPPAPTGCTATDGIYCDKVGLAWTDNAGNEDGFRVYRDGSEIADLPANSSAYNDYSAVPCMTYSYYVQAYNNCGGSSSSNTDSGWRWGAPVAPSDCAATDDDPTRIRVTWADNATGICSESGFRIYREGTLIGIAGANVEYYDDVPPLGGQSYLYEVTAYNSCGESAACGDTGMMPSGCCQIVPSALSLNVDTIGGGDSKTFTITNCGVSQLSGTASTGACGPPEEFTLDSHSYDLGPGASKTFTVTYTPVDYGNDNCTVVISSPCANVVCTATGPVDGCSVSPTTLSFSCSTVGCTDTKTFLITNNGGGPLSGTISESCSEISVTPGSYNLAPGASETFTVLYTCLATGPGFCNILTGCGELVMCTWIGCEPCTNCPSHFTWTDNTGCSYSIVVDGATWEGGALPDCSEIAVYDGGLCVGALCWENTSAGLTAWCDDTQTGPVDGYLCGNGMSFKIYNYATGEICFAAPTYTQGNGTFCDGPFSIVTLDASCCQTVALGSGWNCLSSYMDPVNPDMQAVWADVIAAGRLNIVKNDCTGDFCIPGVICPMVWDPYYAYMAHLTAPDNLMVCGTAIPAQGPVALGAGWNCLPYFPRVPIAPAVALSSCWGSLNIIKSNCTGEFCIPGVFCGIAALDPGEGYMAHLSSPCNLFYATSGPLASGDKAAASEAQPEPSYFNSLKYTGSTYNLVVRDPDGILAHGDEIGIFSGDLCVGAGVWTGGPLGLTAWGDDASTDELDGCADGAALRFRVWDSSAAAEHEVGLKFVQGDGTYGSEAYGLVDLTGFEVMGAGIVSPHVDVLAQSSPNPFNPETSISYNLSRASHVKLRVFNVLGEEVRVLVDTDEGAGIHSVSWDGRDDAGKQLSSGVYFYRLETKHFTSMKKMVLLK